jgi:zinc/manganese transport system permease protein
MRMFEYDFMVNAFAAATVVALVSGLVGYMLVLRGQAFAGHALGHVGFAGATGAVLLGLSPLWGLVLVTVAGGAGMGALGRRLQEADVAIGIVLSLSLGLGLLFLHFFTAYATQATALLFGNVLGVDRATLWTLLGLAVVCLAGLGVIARPLLFASLQPELAEARGVDLRLLSVLFLALVGLAVAECADIVGVLLVFTLMVGPAATAQLCTARLWPGVALSAALAVATAWGALVLAFYTDWPTSFWITAISGVGYVAAVAVRR